MDRQHTDQAPDKHLTAPNVLITGASQRIGRATALYLAEKGYNIALHYRSSEKAATALADKIRAASRHVVLLQADLKDADAVARLVPDAQDALKGPITHLVNNASLFQRDTLADFTTDAWHAHMAVNSLAPMLLSQSLANHLPAGVKGSIVNMIDQRVWRPNPTFFTYTASKNMLWALTKTSAQALAPHIRVNAIGPGPTLASIHQKNEEFEREAAAVPLQHGPTVDEIARMVHTLFTTPSMTGQMIALDGGQHLAWQTPDVAHTLAAGQDRND